MVTESEKLLVLILFLRKRIRISGNFSKNKIFAKMGIGVFKYELCSNLKLKYFDSILTILSNSNIRKTYSVYASKFSEQKINIEKLSKTSSFVEQIANKSLVISGGYQFSQDLLQIYQENKPSQNYKMKNSRSLHKTNFDKRNTIFIISGITQISQQGIYVVECETFDVQKQTFDIIQQILTPVIIFGCDQFDQKLYVFGGNAQKVIQDKIQIYDKKQNL